jgi:hypothetical protein
MRRNFPGTLALLLLLARGRAAAVEPTETPAFSRKPAVTRAGDGWRVEFAVTRETDVAVYVENAKGDIVRHLAAGRLGKNPPEPLRAGSLEQSLTWDGKDDDGKPAEGAPFRIRVGLGLKASWGGVAFSDTDRATPNSLESVIGLAPGPDGRVYVMSNCMGWLYWGSTRIHVYRRDGSYEKTIKPFPPTLPPERIKSAGAFVNSFGAVNPIVYRPLGFSFYPHDDVAHQPAVTPDGRIVLATRTADTHMYATGGVGIGHLAMIDTEGGIPEPSYAGPSLKGGWTPYPVLACSSDGKSIYFSGLGAHNAWGHSKPWHAVYRATLPGRGPQEAFFGDPAVAGSDQGHLKDPRGLSVDGKGHLLVADAGNNRVVILKEADKSVAGSFDVSSPDWLAVHPRTGAVYVQSGDAVIKFSGWNNAKEVARLALPKLKDKVWRLALDASAEPPVVWVGQGSSLMRAEDAGSTFGDLIQAGSVATRFTWRPTADPTRRLIAARIGGAWGSKLHILDEATGKERVLSGDVVGTEGRTHRLGRDGSIYGVDHSAGVIRYDGNGKVNPFPATASHPILKGRLDAGNSGTTAWERDFWVDRRNDLYVRKRGPEYHGLKTLEVYDSEGRHQRTALWTVSDAMYGPRVDARGNIVIMDMIKPLGEPFPREFEGRLTTQRAPHWYNWIYGSVIKFGPEGGAIWFADGAASPLRYDGWSLSSSNSVTNLRATGGSLRGDITKKPAEVGTPIAGLDAATENQIVMRLKNESDGTQAALSWHVAGEPYGSAPRKKTIPIKPNSDFIEVTFDMSAEKEWKGTISRIFLSPTNGAKGSFSIDWVKVQGAPTPKLWSFDKEDTPETKLPAHLKKEEVAAYTKAKGNVLQGATWWRSGFSPLGKTQGNDTCHCTASDFDMDDFGRVFVPDTGRFRIGVLDASGNELLSFGAYGNQDFCGPDSYVLDPATRQLRPRRPDDPKDLKSPFASPEIAFGWIVGLAVTDRYAYVDDVVNKRMLRVKLDYAVSETAAAP